MDLAAAFYLSVYGLAALSGGILAWAEQSPSVTTLTPPIALVALFLNERFRVLRLGGFWIVAIGLVAFIYPTYEFFNGEEEVRVLAGAHLLAILQWVLMFYDKSAHEYWWICALSCLQIALAALLTSSAWFGLFIMIYMFLALWTLSVFTLLMARLRYQRENDSNDPQSVWIWPRLRAAEVVSQSLIQKRGDAATGSEFRNAFQGNIHEADLNWRFVCGVCGMSCAALLLGMVFFLLTPRLWMGTGNPFQDTILASSATATGHSEKVQLRDFGRILESSAPALELTLFDDRTNAPLDLHEYLAQIGQTEPLLRGGILAVYQGGEWFAYASSQPSKFGPNPIRPGNLAARRYVRQTIRLEAIDSHTIFSLVDPEYGQVEDQSGDIQVFRDTRALILSMQQSGLRGAIRYHLIAPERTGNPSPPRYRTIADEKPMPRLDRAPTDHPDDRPRGPGRRRIGHQYLEVPGELTYTREIAQQILLRVGSQTAPDEPTPTQIADAVVSYLRDSGIYQYSLDQSRIDPELDAIEDFLKNRKAGHCQYFATSLALILRVAGIPSRIVTGFKGGLETPESGLLQVQQRHAHAWVEARLNDIWVTLDATPADARDQSVAAIGERVRWYHTWISLASTLWNDYVVNLSFTMQQRDLYAPLTSVATLLKTQLANLADLPDWRRFGLNPAEWFSVRGGVTAFCLMLGMAGICYLGRYLWLLIVQVSLGTHGKSRSRNVIEFYEQFLALIKPLGFVPKSNQTQLEFAQQVAAAWTTRQLPEELRSLALDISMDFYRLRFGSEVLTPIQEAAIKTRLKQLELQLNQSPRSPTDIIG